MKFLSGKQSFVEIAVWNDVCFFVPGKIVEISGFLNDICSHRYKFIPTIETAKVLALIGIGGL
jgi:hypothetical protein